MDRRIILGGILALFILQACDNETPEAAADNYADNNEVTFTSSIENVSASRAYDGTWEKGDMIGVFMLASDGGGVMDSNVPYITAQGDGNFLGRGGVIRVPDDGTETVDFVAYYPYDENMGDDMVFSVDVSDQSVQSAIDLLVSDNLTGVSVESLQTGDNNLTFTHVLSKLVLNLSSSEGNSLAGITAVVTGTVPTATVSLSGKTVTPGDGTSEITMYVNETGTQAEAILVPQDISGNLKIMLSIDGKSKEVNTNISGEIAGGTRYICNLSISNAGSEISVDPEATGYARWMETPVITQSQMEQSNIHYICNYGPDDTSVRNYSMLYDSDLKIAYWVAYPLCSYYTEGGGKRTNAWGYDPSLSTTLQANLSGAFTGYDRGHQIPSADRLKSDEMNKTTFYYTNMTPQNSTLNQGVWAKLEEAVRGWYSGVDTLYVVTGAMPAATVEYVDDSDGNPVAVPEYYFKALARKLSSTGTYQTLAFRMDNEEPSGSYSQYSLSVNELEEITGFTFFPEIDGQYKDNSTVW